MSRSAILELDELKTHYTLETNIIESLFGEGSDKVHAVDGVDMTLHENESIAVIGESGCGKTTLLQTLIGLQDPTGGEIYYRGEALSEFDKRGWKEYRRNVRIIFQDPFNSMNPKMTVRETLVEPLEIHGLDDKEERIHDILANVELSPPETYLDRTPDELSGGEKQRVSIARALILEPEIILADEPVSMLDVSTQAAILELLSDLIDDFGVSMLYISHDLSTVSYICHYLHVMYLGRFVESAPAEQLIDDPKHPYSQALINAVPIPDPDTHRERVTLSGAPSEPINVGEGCRFRDRCPERFEKCDITPPDFDVGEDQTAACHLYDEQEGA